MDKELEMLRAGDMAGWVVSESYTADPSMTYKDGWDKGYQRGYHAALQNHGMLQKAVKKEKPSEGNYDLATKHWVETQLKEMKLGMAAAQIIDTLVGERLQALEQAAAKKKTRKIKKSLDSK